MAAGTSVKTIAIYGWGCVALNKMIETVNTLFINCYEINTIKYTGYAKGLAMKKKNKQSAFRHPASKRGMNIPFLGSIRKRQP